jgi:hypothetical protein
MHTQLQIQMQSLQTVLIREVVAERCSNGHVFFFKYRWMVSISVWRKLCFPISPFLLRPKTTDDFTNVVCAGEWPTPSILGSCTFTADCAHCHLAWQPFMVLGEGFKEESQVPYFSGYKKEGMRNRNTSTIWKSSSENWINSAWPVTPASSCKVGSHGGVGEGRTGLI